MAIASIIKLTMKPYFQKELEAGVVFPHRLTQPEEITQVLVCVPHTVSNAPSYLCSI